MKKLKLAALAVAMFVGAYSANAGEFNKYVESGNIRLDIVVINSGKAIGGNGRPLRRGPRPHRQLQHHAHLGQHSGRAIRWHCAEDVGHLCHRHRDVESTDHHTDGGRAEAHREPDGGPDG